MGRLEAAPSSLDRRPTFSSACAAILISSDRYSGISLSARILDLPTLVAVRSRYAKYHDL
jgi:hypothetical protein